MQCFIPREQMLPIEKSKSKSNTNLQKLHHIGMLDQLHSRYLSLNLPDPSQTNNPAMSVSKLIQQIYQRRHLTVSLIHRGDRQCNVF